MWLPHLSRKQEEPVLTNPEWCLRQEVCEHTKDRDTASRCICCGWFSPIEEAVEDEVLDPAIRVIRLGDAREMTPEKLEEALNKAREQLFTEVAFEDYQLVAIEVMPSNSDAFFWSLEMVAIFEVR